jgi:hypothetical protein
MTKKEILNEAGKRIISFVRDDAICDYEQLESGELKPPDDQDLHRRLRSLPKEHIALVREIAIRMVDQTLHNCLWMLEGGEGLELLFKTGDGEVVNLTELSDGLAGELYSEEGWIAKFSKYPPTL